MVPVLIQGLPDYSYYLSHSTKQTTTTCNRIVYSYYNTYHYNPTTGLNCVCTTHSNPVVLDMMYSDVVTALHRLMENSNEAVNCTFSIRTLRLNGAHYILSILKDSQNGN